MGKTTVRDYSVPVRSERDFLKICVWTAVASLLISVWCVLTDDVINDDGILYIHTARLFAEGNVSAALNVMGASRWPFYPWLIAFVGQIFGIDLEWAAHGIDTFALVLAAVFFLAIVRELNSERVILVAAAVTFLIFPTLNDYRDQIIRDHGYMACYLASVWTFLRYYLRPSLVSGLAWLVAGIMAALFRIEGVVFLLLLPLLFLIRKPFRRSASYALYPYLILVASVSLVAMMVLGQMPVSPEQVRLSEPLTILQRLTESSGSSGAGRILAASEDFLLRVAPSPRWAPTEFAPAVAVATFLIVLLGEIGHATTPVFLGLAAYGLWKGEAFPSREVRAVWLGFVVVNLVVLGGRLGDVFFITERHSLALALTLMLAVPFGLRRLVCVEMRKDSRQSEQASTVVSGHGTCHFPSTDRVSRARRYVIAGVALLLTYGAADGVTSFGPGKGYLREAGVWIKEHAGESERLFSNNSAVAYYAGRGGLGFKEGIVRDDLGAEKLKAMFAAPAWVALHQSQYHGKLVERLQALGLPPPAKVFSNSKGKRVLVFSPGSKSGDNPSP